MKAMEYTGVIPPMLSSFTPEGEIYEKGMREIIRFTLPHVHGLYPIGTYGCGPLMSLSDRKRMLEIINSSRGYPKPRFDLLEPELVIRRSCGCK